MELTSKIGPYYVGEDPEPLEITVTDADGVAIDITACTIGCRYAINGGTPVDIVGSITDGGGGVMRIDWPSGFTAAGVIRGQVTYESVGGEIRVADSFHGRILTPVGSTL
mgnify:FL=1